MIVDIIVIMIIVAAIVMTLLACCKVSGDCSRAEEQEEIEEKQ